MRAFLVPVLLVLVLGSAAPRGTLSAAPPQSVNSPIDLAQIQLLVPGKVTIGKLFRVTDEVENQGNALAARTVTYFYLSTDDQLSEDDVLVGGRRVPELGARQSHSTVTPVTLKATVTPGAYYFLAVADGRHELEERSRLDNVRAVKVQVLPAAEKK